MFAVLVVVSLAVTVPAGLAGSTGVVRAVVVVSAVVLTASWLSGYRRRAAPVATDLVDSVALLGLVLADSQAEAVLPVVCAILWFRAQYCSVRRGRRPGRVPSCFVALNLD